MAQEKVSLDLVRQEVSGCQKCPELASTRTKTVFGSGPVPARLMLLGEAPGAEENLAGLPFVGAAGKLLSNIISACGWRREDIYIANVLCCRPPGNRRPHAEEAKNCRGYLDAQIDAVSPEWIVCLGATAASSLLGIEPVVGPNRGKVFDYKSAKVVVTYHPANLLRSPENKSKVWDDLQLIITSLREELGNGLVRRGNSGGDDPVNGRPSQVHGEAEERR